MKAAPAFARVKQSVDWGLSVGSRGPSQAATGPWLQSYLSPAQSRGGEQRESSVTRDTGSRGHEAWSGWDAGNEITADRMLARLRTDMDRVKTTASDIRPTPRPAPAVCSSGDSGSVSV